MPMARRSYSGWSLPKRPALNLISLASPAKPGQRAANRQSRRPGRLIRRRVSVRHNQPNAGLRLFYVGSATRAPTPIR